MLGHRGCRLGIAYPEITAMQVRAILEAACLVKKEGVDVHPEIMIPLVGVKKELEDQATVVRRVAAEVFAEQGVTVDYLVGTMIEIPRAALTADKIAEVAEFFSFGTNDLTQMTFGVSRDDAGKFLPLYVSEEKEIWPADPFATLDQEGVGQLVEMGIERGRSTQARPQGRHLRRARRRSRERQVLPPRRHELRELLAVPHPGRTARRGAGGDRRAQRTHAREVGEGAAWPSWAAKSLRGWRTGANCACATRAHATPVRWPVCSTPSPPSRPSRCSWCRASSTPASGGGASPMPSPIRAACSSPRTSTASWSATSACTPTRTRARVTSPASACRSARAGAACGVGGALLEASATWAAAHAVSKLALGVFPENRRAIGFYERHGFVREGLRRAQYDRAGRYHDEVLMARFLTPAP